VYTQTLVANGAKVYITGRRLEVLETTARTHGAQDSSNPSKGSIVPIAMDVTDKESIKKVVDQITEKEGYLNMYVHFDTRKSAIGLRLTQSSMARLVNNAGIWTSKPNAGPEDGPEAFSKDMFAENIDDWQRGTCCFIQLCSPSYYLEAHLLELTRR
jgi:NAD(P)-dependent dehydrogenase (short-subunit alcohol dehydrogenase family)